MSKINIRKFLKLIIPSPLFKTYKNLLTRPLKKEIESLDIHSMGIDNDGDPWVKIKNGLVFFGFLPKNSEKVIFEILSNELNIDYNYIAVLVEIIERYIAPRSLPGELINSRSSYNLIRDPLNDFDFKKPFKKEIADKFRPKKNDIIMDIGAYHGFGTLKIAEYLKSTGSIIAVEVDPINYKLLCKNIIKNGFDIIKPFNYAISDHSSENGFFYFDNEPSGNSLRSDVLKNLDISNLKKLPAKLISGDSLLSKLEINKLDHLNITINGGEPEALEGLRSTIENSNDIRITMPGWYFRDGERLDKTLKRSLKELKFSNIYLSKKGRVLAWK